MGSVVLPEGGLLQRTAGATKYHGEPNQHISRERKQHMSVGARSKPYMPCARRTGTGTGPFTALLIMACIYQTTRRLMRRLDAPRCSNLVRLRYLHQFGKAQRRNSSSQLRT